MAVGYFSYLFREDVFNCGCVSTQNYFKQIFADRMCNLDSMPTMEELRRVLFSMGGTKAPGNDGCPAIFYQKTGI